MEETTTIIEAVDGSPQQLLIGNDLVIETIMSFVKDRKELLNCMLTCKAICNIPARWMYRSCNEKDLEGIWKRGCSMSRFQIYANGVRTLYLDLELQDLEFESRLTQYEHLVKIVLLSDPDRRIILVEEIYLYDHRQISVEGKVALEDVALGGQLLPIPTSAHVVWGGIRSLIQPERAGGMIEDIFPSEVLSAAGTDSGLSLLPNLVHLELPGVELSLESLGTIFAGYPSLKSLKCALDNHSRDTIPQKQWFAALKALMRGPGAGLQELDVSIRSMSILGCLSYFRGCKVVKLSGLMMLSKGKFWVWLRQIAADTPSSIQKLVISPRFFVRGEAGDGPEAIDPYQFAKVMMRMVSPRCIIRINTEGYKGDGAVAREKQLWIHLLRTITETLQEERRLGDGSKGWSHVDTVHDE